MAWDDDEDMDLARSLKICPILVDACGIKKGEELAWPSVFPESRGRGSGFVAAAAAVVAAATAAPFSGVHVHAPAIPAIALAMLAVTVAAATDPNTAEQRRACRRIYCGSPAGDGPPAAHRRWQWPPCACRGARCLAGMQLFLDLE